jgi:hypothetical protein
MVSRVHTHSNDEPDVQDMHNDDNSENQEEVEKQVDCKEEDTMRSNESRDIKKIIKEILVEWCSRDIKELRSYY